MNSETMDVEQLAAYLRRDVREVGKLASRGNLPGRKVGGVWRFARAEINHWIETQLPEYSDQQLTDLEKHGDIQPLLATYLSEDSIAVPLRAHTKVATLRELVRLADESGQIYDTDAVLEAVRAREELGSTALPNGVAIPHPRRPLPAALGESVIAYARSTSGIPFGGEHGLMTDIFFLVACRDDRTHLSVLARLTRVLQMSGVLDELRQSETAADSYEVIVAAEQELL